MDEVVKVIARHSRARGLSGGSRLTPEGAGAELEYKSTASI
jgi:hypothetical protein